VNWVKFTVNRVPMRSKAEIEANFSGVSAPPGKAPGVQQSPVNPGPQGRAEP
jgi:hypothetical protein